MSGLPTGEAILIIRAFGYFSHLANLAEDQHHIRRTRAYAMAEAPARRGTMAYALARAQDAGVTREQLEGFFGRALCVAVLTAHPTEVRRQSTIDREREIAHLLDQRDRVRFTPEELNDNRRALRRNVLTLWQTSLIRHSRLRVLDEVVNALAYYDHTFLAALPEFYADLEDQLGFDVPSFLRMGSWIGGDRDGNPNVTAEVTRETLAMQSQRALRHHLDELHLLGGELPLYGPMVHVSEALQALADRSPDTADERKDEPYRRALTGMYARLAATAWSLDKLEAPHPPVGLRPPTRRRTNSRPISIRSATRSAPTISAPWLAAGCGRCGARSTCSASISPNSTSARIPMCTSASWPSWSRRPGRARTMRQ